MATNPVDNHDVGVKDMDSGDSENEIEKDVLSVANSPNRDKDRSAFEQALLRRVDIRVLPLLGCLFAVSLIDRTNLSTARLVGMQADLKLGVGNRYSTVSCLYFVPYILLQIPSNILLRQFGARPWLSANLIAWGAVQMSMAFVPNWGLLAFCRVLLGVFEAGAFPCLVFIVSTWYKRHEVQKRLAGFYLLAIVISSFSGILGYAFSRLKGRAGLAGWSWLFLIEGLMTVVLGMLVYLFVADFPHKNSFLTKEETEFVLNRVEEDRGDSLPDTISLTKILKHLADWTVWAYGLMYMCATMPSYAIGFFIVIILNGMGWSIKNSLLLTIPPFAFAALSALFFAWLSDRTRQRALWIAVQSIMTLVGMVITAYAKVPGPRYFGIFLANAGSAGCILSILAYSANNVVSHSKRAVSTAIVVAWGAVGGLFATTVFRQQDYPKYIPGLWATIGCQFTMLALLAATTLHFSRRNREARDSEGGTGVFEPLEGQPGFLYTL